MANQKAAGNLAVTGWCRSLRGIEALSCNPYNAFYLFDTSAFCRSSVLMTNIRDGDGMGVCAANFELEASLCSDTTAAEC